ncbi:5-oxo-1,2,5-tricarboxylic-3-penten acid decarboxylase [Edaphobacter acidisoli]|uniref:5-oxo-1,2,5-tricarboxylic-3-penten acid decarboxylase n=1 Tax=Edaphobacter acidisoli TaxID=2040573 RepID=A0A916RUB2_9BACT|nr:fumarylacetoacetate hydrolase family protein [Edaphobacter acidisoli]GGA70733.1 5-oxo-1,2,5-tricarboxylic-3-penten acid decarboxylase [Edaphobacter acidisoli]
MRYAKFLSLENGALVPRYAFVEQRDNALWATELMAPPEEDLAARNAPPTDFDPKPLADLHLLAPVHPSKIICVGRNYRDHAAELGNEVPKEPLLFLKPPSSLLAPRGVVRMPLISSRVDYEGELAIVIGRRCHNLGPTEDARPYIRGYTIVNDVTARDIQKSDGQWTRGKGFDTFCPTGPIVSSDIDPCGSETTPATPVTVTTRLNGTVKQQGSTRDLIFPIAHLLRYITATMTLEPGDLIPTGTPAGVGPVQPLDTVQIEIDGLGTLENTFAAD